MGYFCRTHPTPELVREMVNVAILEYKLLHDKDPKDVVVNLTEETIAVDGHMFVFSNFI